MFCPSCGKRIAEGDAFCRSCGRSLLEGGPVSGESASGSPAVIPATKREETPRRSGEATASLVLGIFSFIPVIGLVAVIFGHLAKSSIRQARQEGRGLRGEGMANVGLLFGYLGLAGWVVYGLTLVVHPLLPSTQRAENQAAAVGSLRTINTANVTYNTTFDQGYAPSLAALGPPKGGTKSSPKAADLVDENLASGTDDGYRFTYSPGPTETTLQYMRKQDKSITADEVSDPNRLAINTYAVHADPVTPGETGDVHYFIDESGIIRFELNKPAGASSMAIAQ